MGIKIKNLLNEIDKVSAEYGLDVGKNTILDLMVLLAKLDCNKKRLIAQSEQTVK